MSCGNFRNHHEEEDNAQTRIIFLREQLRIIVDMDPEINLTGEY
jgi:hypothetical protein